MSAQRVSKLRDYKVTLFEDKNSEQAIVFKCQAENKPHAREQALSAYPNCIIGYVLRNVEGTL